MTESNLFTTCNFQGKDYLIKMSALQNCLEILITDKRTGEEWHCNYDSIYIENLTHKTGNYKQFDIFVAMLKSGLLKTSNSVTLDLLTYDDLETLRIRRLRTHLTCTHSNCSVQNKRYLILTYSVEFDRIHYPIPLDYSGPPDPKILQSTIERLESELERLREERGSKENPQEIIMLQRRKTTCPVPKNSHNSIHILYKRDSSSNAKGANNIKQMSKSKSDSPVMARRETWQKIKSEKQPRTASSLGKVKIRSRSSSASSYQTQYSPTRMQENKLSNEYKCESARSQHSRSSSISSSDSRCNCKKTVTEKSASNKTSGYNVHQIHSSDVDFDILEERIQVLQNLLNENMKFK